MTSKFVRIGLSSALRAGFTATLVFALMGLTAPDAQAQTGQITGTVTSATSGAPLGEVQVFLPDLDLGALSRADGRFLILNIPVGTHEVSAQRIGFGVLTQTATVTAGGTAALNFALETQALGLDDIIVTGTAGAATRREIGNTISSISAADIPDAPTRVSDMLQAAAPGLDVYGGGALGQSKIIRLRGSNSALLNEHPIIYIDGVRIRSEPLPDANPPDRRGGRSGNIAVSPLDLINPNDIDRIEIIKGSAATTLYGTEASGGVIQVFTKRGTGGAPVWTAEVQTGTQWSRRVGPSPAGLEAGVVRDLVEDAQFGNMQHWMCTGILSCGGQFAKQSYNQDYTLSVRGGSSGVNYFISGAFNDAQGLMPNDHATNYSSRANITLSPTSDLQIQWNTSYTNLFLTTTAGQNNAQGLPLNALRTERNYFATSDPTVLNVLMDQQLDESVERFTTGLTLNYSPMAALSNRFVVGYDWSQREHRNLRPYGWNQVPEGSLLNNTYQNRVLSLDYVGTYAFTLTSEIRSDFSWGGQAVGDDDRLLEGFAENFPGAADPTISSGAVRLGFEDRSKIWNAGFFFQNVLDVSNKYFFTLGVRVDGNSAFGSGFGLQTYPKASVAYVISDEDFYPDWGEMKLRFAYGESGRAPGPFDAVRTWSPQGLAGSPAFVPANVGNPDIGPEVTKEIEGGFDASWLNNRLSTAFTYYKQTTNDALFNVPQIPSGGFTSSRRTNIGSIGNSGLELQVDASLIQGSSWGLDVGLNYSTNHSELLSIDPDLETNCFKVGYPLRARCNQKIANPDAIVSSFGEVLFVQPGHPDFQGEGDAENQYLYGPNLPTTFISPSMTIRMPKGITVSARGDYKGGFFMNEEMYSISRSVRSPLCFPYYVDPANSNQVKDNIPAQWMARCGNTRQREGYMWDASFFKLRSVSATIPVDFAFPDRIGNSVLTVALNNGFLWMKEMPFMDPEASADPGGGAQQGYNFEETVPAPITFRVALRVTF